ncbi:actophorin, partial [Biomphalaria pfeifferi]
SPDMATIKQKMIYTSSKQALRNKMRGIHAEIQCTEDSDLTMSNVLERICSKYT